MCHEVNCPREKQGEAGEDEAVATTEKKEVQDMSGVSTASVCVSEMYSRVFSWFRSYASLESWRPAREEAEGLLVGFLP